MSKPKKPRPLPSLSREPKPVKNVSTPEDPDAGMLPDEDDQPLDTTGMTDAEVEAALRKKYGDAMYERMSSDW